MIFAINSLVGLLHTVIFIFNNQEVTWQSFPLKKKLYSRGTIQGRVFVSSCSRFHSLILATRIACRQKITERFRCKHFLVLKKLVLNNSFRITLASFVVNRSLSTRNIFGKTAKSCVHPQRKVDLYACYESNNRLKISILDVEVINEHSLNS